MPRGGKREGAGRKAPLGKKDSVMRVTPEEKMLIEHWRELKQRTTESEQVATSLHDIVCWLKKHHPDSKMKESTPDGH